MHSSCNETETVAEFGSWLSIGVNLGSHGMIHRLSRETAALSSERMAWRIWFPFEVFGGSETPFSPESLGSHLIGACSLVRP
jgi:hypothetical protein